MKVANLSTVIVPEFFSYSIDENDTQTYEWYEAIDCIDLYTEIYGSFDAIPHSLSNELRPLRGNRWLCPNFKDKDFILQNDPWSQNIGTSLTFVVNFCKVSAERQNITDSGCMTDDA